MFSNYLLIAWRNLLKNKVFSLINIFGLAVSLAVCTLILLYVHNELTYDSYHSNADRIMRLTTTISSPGSSQLMVISGEGAGPLLKDELPEVQDFVRLTPDFGAKTVIVGDKIMKEKYILGADPQVFQVFSYQLLEGDPATALSDARSIVLTESMARKYFGRKSAMGMELTIYGKVFIVTGIMDDLPANVDTKVNALTGYTAVEGRELLKFAYVTYILLKEGVDHAAFSAKLEEFTAKHYHPFSSDQFRVDLAAQPLEDVHFTGGYYLDTPKGNARYPWIFLLVALLLFILALFNFINLSSIRMLERCREVGIRKTIGARRSQLIIQFLTESILLLAIAMTLAFTLLQLSLDTFNQLLEKDFSLTDRSAFSLAVMGIGCLGALVGFSCILPARRIVSLPASAIMKGNFKGLPKRFNLRKVLIVAQFAISGFMVAGISTIAVQMNFIRHKEMGFHKENILVVDFPDNVSGSTAASFKNEILSLTGVLNASLVGPGAVPGSSATKGHLTVLDEGREDEYWMNFISVDEEFLELMGIALNRGRSFNELTVDEKRKMVIVNEAFVQQAGLQDPVGTEVQLYEKGQIAGVINSYHYTSIHNMVEPLAIDLIRPKLTEDVESQSRGINIATLLVKLDPIVQPVVEETYRRFFPNVPMEHYYLDQALADLYGSEAVLMQLFSWFTGLAILVACLGLFGLSGHIIHARTKEIGIRKVLGAGTASIIRLLTSEFIRLVLIAQVVAVPLAVWAAERWLDSYAYRIELQWWLFGASALTVLVVAVFTVAVKSMRAAHANPVEALRTE